MLISVRHPGIKKILDRHLGFWRCRVAVVHSLQVGLGDTSTQTEAIEHLYTLSSVYEDVGLPKYERGIYLRMK